MLVINEPTWKDIPHEPEQKMAFRVLSWKDLRDARKIAEKEQRETLRELGGELMKAILEASDDPDGERKIRRAQNRLQYHESNFDTGKILELAVVEWSYEQPFDSELIGSLDEKTAIWAKQTAIDLTRPDDEEASKND